MNPDARWMAAALALAGRGRGRTAPNPPVGCLVATDGIVVGRGWTAPGGRPHAEALALDQAGDKSRGATVYVTLEPCAHDSERGPACAALLVAAAPARVVIALRDPDPRTDGRGIERLRAAGIAVEVGVGEADAKRAAEGFLNRRAVGRPHVTLKLATSLDGRIALADGSSRWITGARARAHAHLERARADAILIGRGTLIADAPALDVRLEGIEDRAPLRVVLGSAAPPGWVHLSAPKHIAGLDGIDHLLVEGGARTAGAFLEADLVDRLLLYRAPILIGDGLPAVAGLSLPDLASAHGRWRLDDARMLGPDRLESYARVR